MSGWIEWAGGKNPVPGQRVEVRFRRDVVGAAQSDAYWGWLHRGVSHDIIAYRLVTEPETLGPSASFWSNVRTEPEAQPPGDGFQLSSEERERLTVDMMKLEVLVGNYGGNDDYDAFDRIHAILAALSRKERES